MQTIWGPWGNPATVCVSVREEDSRSLVSRSLVYFVIFFLPFHAYSSNFFPLSLYFLLYFTSDNTADGTGLETFRKCIICDVARLFGPAAHCGWNCTVKCHYLRYVWHVTRFGFGIGFSAVVSNRSPLQRQILHYCAVFQFINIHTEIFTMYIYIYIYACIIVLTTLKMATWVGETGRWSLRKKFTFMKPSAFVGIKRIITIIIIIIMIKKGVRRVTCSLILKVNLVSPSLPRSS